MEQVDPRAALSQGERYSVPTNVKDLPMDRAKATNHVEEQSKSRKWLLLSCELSRWLRCLG